MLKVGVTGQQGFVGQHLYNTLGLYPEQFERVDFKREYFEDAALLNDFVSKCDVIVHLAAINRHDDPQVIYDLNIQLVNRLAAALEDTKSKAHVLFSSSTQEEKENLYGKSKKDGRKILENWAAISGGKFTGLVIPNVFGPFGNPFYNSFVATFCYQLTHDEIPTVDVDGEVKLIYVDELVAIIIQEVLSAENSPLCVIKPTAIVKVSNVLMLLETFRATYFYSGVIPELNNKFELDLFNTFRSYIDLKTFFPVELKQHADDRGTFVEVIRLGTGGQVSFSTTLPGVIRGNHYHTRKIERFAVIKGKARIHIRKINTDDVICFDLSGDNPSFVDMPVWYTHNIENVGSEELYTMFWINEFYDVNDPDTYLEQV